MVLPAAIGITWGGPYGKPEIDEADQYGHI